MGKVKSKANGEGTIFRYRNGWRGQIVIEDSKGSACRVSANGKTKQEVIDKLAELKTDYNRGDYVFKSDTTVAEWAKHWLETYKKPNMTYGSHLRYKSLIDNHLLPTMGEYKLQELTKPLLEQSYGKMFQKKMKKGDTSEYSHATLNALTSLFKKCLQEAVANGILNKNPHDGVQLHKLRPSKKVSAYTQADQETLIKYLKESNDIDQLYYFLFGTGIRIGEALAINWGDVDFENKTININKIAVEEHAVPKIEDRTKTESGKRMISVSDKVVEILKRLKKNQREELNALDLVFPTQRYTIRTTANLRRRWESICKSLEIEYKGLHALRHTWATRALESGVDIKTVSAMMGHKNVVTTMNIYQDSLQEHQELSVVKMDKFL